MRPGHYIYLSGPITDVPDYRRHFAVAAHRLRELGHYVFNPAESFDGDGTLPREAYMRYDIGRLLEAECVVVLPGWTESDGAVFEAQLAWEIGLDVYLVDHLDTPIKTVGETLRFAA